jgi:hypothetical protein
MDKWREGSLYDHIDQFANSLGYENAAVAISLAMISWDSVEDRNSFIQAITGDSPKGNDGRNYISGIQKG